MKLHQQSAHARGKPKFKLKSLLLFCLFVPMLAIASAQTFSLKELRMGDSLLNLSQYDNALSVFNHLLANPTLDDSLKAEIFYRKGFIFYSKDSKDSAVGYYKNALAIFSQHAYLTKVSNVNRLIGLLYLSIKNYDEALFYNNAALATAQLTTDSLTDYFDICRVYEAKGDFKKMYDIIINNISHFKNDIIPDQTYLIASNLGQYYLSIKKYDSALYYYHKTLPVAKYDVYLTASYANISDVYKELKNYKQAILYQDSAYRINRQSGSQQDRLYIFDSYKKIYSDMGDIKDALKYAELGRGLSDSIYIGEQTKALQDGEVKYKTKQKEDDNIILAIDNNLKQRKIVFSFIALGLVALLAIISFRNYKLKQKANNILTIQKEQVQQLANELEVANQTKARLFSTIGHDLRSPISSLYALLKMQEINGGNTIDAATMSTQTINLLDTLEDLLVWSKTQMDRFVPMPIHININGLYAELTDFFAGTLAANKVQIINKALPSLTLRCDENILRTMLRNAIGNAITHTPTGEEVHLLAENEGAFLACTIKNPCSQSNFDRFKAAFENAGVQSGSHGLGLVLIKEFADKIDASVHLSYADGWVAICISIPINN